MKRFMFFIAELIKKIMENDLMSYANAMTYKIILSMLPFIIFIMSLTAFFNLNIEDKLEYIMVNFPDNIKAFFDSMIKDVFETKRIELLSFSLIISLFSASSGVLSLMKGLNKVYEIDEKRNFFIVRIISVLIVFLVGLMVVIMSGEIIFKDKIIEFLAHKGIFLDFSEILGYIMVEITLLVMIILLYRVAIYRNIKLKYIMPGAVFDLFAMCLTSKAFNIYINTFSNYSVFYGSLGGIFILMIWINLLSAIILIGGQINYITESRETNKDV